MNRFLILYALMYVRAICAQTNIICEIKKIDYQEELYGSANITAEMSFLNVSSRKIDVEIHALALLLGSIKFFEKDSAQEIRFYPTLQRYKPVRRIEFSLRPGEKVDRVIRRYGRIGKRYGECFSGDIRYSLYDKDTRGKYCYAGAGICPINVIQFPEQIFTNLVSVSRNIEKFIQQNRINDFASLVDSRYLTFDIPNCFDCIRKNLHDKNAKIKCCIESREDLYGKVLNEEINSYMRPYGDGEKLDLVPMLVYVEASGCTNVPMNLVAVLNSIVWRNGSVTLIGKKLGCRYRNIRDVENDFELIDGRTVSYRRWKRLKFRNNGIK